MWRTVRHGGPDQLTGPRRGGIPTTEIKPKHTIGMTQMPGQRVEAPVLHRHAMDGENGTAPPTRALGRDLW